MKPETDIVVARESGGASGETDWADFGLVGYLCLGVQDREPVI